MKILHLVKNFGALKMLINEQANVSIISIPLHLEEKKENKKTYSHLFHYPISTGVMKILHLVKNVNA